MLEKDIENLIANYPDEFFPNAGFKLIGQQVRLGKCFVDILFEDKHNRKIIVEVKRGILSRDASGQVMEYYGLLKSQNLNVIIELILCANIIPPERRTFLEISGIECKELGINLINQVAEKVNYQFINSPVKTKAVATNEELPISERIWIFQANPKRYDIMNALADDEIGEEMHWLVNQHKKEIVKGDIGIIWLSGKEAGIYAITEILTDPTIMGEPDSEKKYWTDSEDKEGKKLRVKMKIVKNMLSSPLTKEKIILTKELQYMSIFLNPRGTNFPIKSDEWDKIRDLIKQ